MHDELDTVSDGLRSALQELNVPSYILDRSFRVWWLNDAAQKLFGNIVGRYGTTIVAPEHRNRALEHFTSKLSGTTTVTDFDLNLVRTDGGRLIVRISSSALTSEGRVLGVFGIVSSFRAAEPVAPAAELTPRQHEVLVLLGEGRSTEEIAAHLELSVDTVRNHAREILRRLGVHSRIAAVAIARRQGLL